MDSGESDAAKETITKAQEKPCEAHLNTSPLNIIADSCAGDKLMNLKNEKQSLGGPEKNKSNKQNFFTQIIL